MKKILLVTALLTMSLFADFKSIGVEEFKKLQKEGTPVLDIRTAFEWQEVGFIDGSHKATFFSEQGQPLLADFFYTLGTLVKDKSEPFIIYCAHASRTKVLGDGLVAMGFENVYELKGGIENGWIKAGERVIKD
ncbi:MAG: Rhodanese-like domain protein [uncultured Sulfurovum sp.]|uniref:Rhodanese-like domain protein n=1 Tax=uncultured Sulfurovum sp. TaxID=269237 RepID=A0A6S6TFI0_9BACT|nr:MAG: Rhodanese-like domain protein [uncultured Sulfurovum sp.]